MRAWLVWLVMSYCGHPLVIDTPMRWSDERAQLTLEYRRTHSDPEAVDLAIEPRVVVLHYTGGGSAAATRAYFDAFRIEAARGQLARAGAVNVSAHFVVDRDGTVFRLQPETRFARHCIGLNHVAIGI
jgi:N-acetyl-anhydromuramyl-L-alanine amidase AmpD